MGEIAESLLDFFFYMLDEFVWRPDYLPSSGVGLPQINFDALGFLHTSSCSKLTIYSYRK
jgi:hypothetical protein